MNMSEQKNDKGYANGYKPKTLRTRIGEITLAVPQVREGGFYQSIAREREAEANVL